MPSAFKLSYWVLSWREEKSKRKYSMCGVCHGWFGLKLLRNLIHLQRIFFNIGQNNSSLYVAVRMIHNSILQRISVNAMPKYGHCIRKKNTIGSNFFLRSIFILYLPAIQNNTASIFAKDQYFMNISLKRWCIRLWLLLQIKFQPNMHFFVS